MTIARRSHRFRHSAARSRQRLRGDEGGAFAFIWRRLFFRRNSRASSDLPSDSLRVELPYVAFRFPSGSSFPKGHSAAFVSSNFAPHGRDSAPRPFFPFPLLLCPPPDPPPFFRRGVAPHSAGLLSVRALSPRRSIREGRSRPASGE